MKTGAIKLILALLTPCLSFSQYYSWAKGMGGTSFEYGKSIQLDGSNNTYITGNFAGTADFDPGVGVANLTGHGNYDIFVAKYDNSGNYIWAKSIGGLGYDDAYSIKLDAGGNVYVTGAFEDTVDFDPGPGIANLISANGDIFIAKYDNAGNYLWAKTVGGSGSEGYDIELDASGNIYLTGNYYQANDFDPGPGAVGLPLGNGLNAFIAKYDNSGNYIWAKGIAGSSNNNGNYLQFDASGNIYLTGNFMGTSDFDPGAGTYTMTSSGGDDVFFAKFDNAGNFIWAKSFGSNVFDYVTFMQMDAAGSIYLTGGFQGTADFDPGVNTSTLNSMGDYDIFIAKYDNSGNYLWAKGIGSINKDFGCAFQLDNSNNIYLTGYFSNTADFDPGAGVSNLVSQGNYDIFIAKYDSAGNYIWAEGIGGVNQDDAFGLCKDASDNIYITGGFSGTTDFDPGANTATLSPAGMSDVFIAKYSSTVAGLKNIAADDSGFKIYPNPFQSIVQLMGESQADGKWTISDNLGRVVYEASDSSSNEIDLSFLAKGIYYLEVQNNEQRKVFKLIKD